MKYLYAILSGGMVALGVLHMLATFRLFHTVNTAALWFFSGGIALVLTGTLNLLHRVSFSPSFSLGNTAPQESFENHLNGFPEY